MIYLFVVDSIQSEDNELLDSPHFIKTSKVCLLDAGNEIGYKDQKLGSIEYFVLIMMMLTHLSGQWQTYLVVYANSGNNPYTSLETDLSLTSTEFSILSGTTFALVGAFFNIIFGILSDKLNRK